MERWLIMAGIASACGVGALAGALGFQALWSLGSAPSPSEPVGVWHAPEIVETLPAPVVTAAPSQERADVEIPPGPSVVFLWSDGPQPEVDRRLLTTVADWSPCAGLTGTVDVMAPTLNGAFFTTLALSEPVGDAPLEACAAAVIQATSTSGAPRDYFMLSARVRLE